MLMKICMFFIVVTVVLQASAPQRSSGFTTVLKSLILAVVPISLDPQMFFSLWKAARALPMRVMTSASVPPWLSRMLPR
ncbi:hypothetical protein DPMN_106814 [Dreissena polymorpha]|uniref:Uncharacterized protein n=1 Tax=Dreissena polymorpha TaxID=45954 RepID=A0A9D4QJ09_DREPO|nr:hypothetical protein DPMN_106814 [Dreissena polymorpha]